MQAVLPASLLGAVVALMVLLPGLAWGSPGLERLEAFYTEIRTVHASFEQRIVGTDGAVQERSRGEVWIHRPDRFRWSYTEPYPQEIVANGQTLKFYDPEMEQITIRPFGRPGGHTPSMVLAGDGDLRRYFELIDQGQTDGIAWVELRPKEPREVGFRKARVGLASDPVRVVRFDFQDRFGHWSRIHLHDIRINPPIESQRFQFTPPAGTEVLRPRSGRE